MLAGGLATIYVTDMERAIRFYTETLGLTLVSRSEEIWAVIDAGGGFTLGLHGMHAGSPQPGTRGPISVGLTITEPFDQVVETLQKRGVSFRRPPSEGANVRLAFFGDPDDNDLYIVEFKART
jgi:catechol 2,3-dioxygenase-like lactoylglutathione lyase family enzyme